MGETITNKQNRRRLALAVALFLFSIYLFAYRGGFHSIDEVSIFAVTESLVKFGRLNTDQIAWTQWTTSPAEAQGFFGQDGHVYSKKGLGLSLAQAPLYWLGLVLPGLGMLQTVSVLNALITASTGLITLMFIRRLNYSTTTAVIAALIYGLTTIAFVYAKYLFSEPLAGFLLLLTAYMLFTYRVEGGLRHVAIAGVVAGSAVLTRANNLFLLPVFGLYLLWIIYQPTQHRPSKQATNVLENRNTSFVTLRSYVPLVLFLLTLAVPGVVLLGYNAVRSGNPLQTGYDLTLFSPNILLGLYKLLFSPLRGLFIYSPILLLSLPGWWLFRKTHPAEAWLLAGLVGVTVGLFSAWSSGEGLSWGSRFLIPVVPFFVIVLAPLIEKVAGKDKQNESRDPSPAPSSALRITFYALLFLSLLIQILGVTMNPWVFLAQIQANFGGEFFLENTAALYDFRYSQIVGQLYTWSPQNSDLVWWQPWGFDWLAFGLSSGLVLLSGWFLWRQMTADHRPPTTNKAPQPTRNSLHTLPYPYLVIILASAITFFLLARYFITDQQFGPPDASYTRALNIAASQASPGDQIVTVAQYHYHVPMNRFRARIPVIGFAQQTWPPPGTTLPLLQASLSGLNSWLVTIGFSPASPDNATEQWLAFNAFKATDEWLQEVRLLRFGTVPPTSLRAGNTRFGQELALVEVKTVETAEPGQILPVEFTWQPLNQPQLDYNLFLQLLDPNGGLLAQHDSQPNGGYSPTSTWNPGEQVLDRHGLALPPDLPAGDYRLIAGLYDPTTGVRLTTTENNDFVELGDVRIIPAEEAGN